MKMNKINEPSITLLDDREYYYVNTTSDLNIDISIFEIDEWNNLLEISNIIESAAFSLQNFSDFEYLKTEKQYKKAATFLKYSKYCIDNKLKGFNEMDYFSGNKLTILEYVYCKVKDNSYKDNTLVSINKFRKWICDNYDEIQNAINAITIII